MRTEVDTKTRTEHDDSTIRKEIDTNGRNRTETDNDRIKTKNDATTYPEQKLMITLAGQKLAHST